MPGGLKGLTMSEDELAIWVESYPVCAHVTLAIDSMYSADDEMKEEKRTEEGETCGECDMGTDGVGLHQHGHSVF